MQKLTDISAKQLRRFAAETKQREQEAIRLFRPLPNQLPFFLSLASERIIRGGNRSGKTVACAIETASAALGIPLLDNNNKPIPFKYPTDRPIMIWVIGYDATHIARIYRFLFEPGLFKVIKDKETHKFRVWRPWEQEDLEREDEVKPSSPLIPKRFIKETAFLDAGKRVFSVVRLQNGSTIEAYSSKGAAGQGVNVDVLWIDEDIAQPGDVYEWQARLAEVRGRLIWSAWPHNNNYALREMSKRAETEKDLESPDVSEIVLRFTKNPYIPEDSKQKRVKAWANAGENVLRARDSGEFLTGDSLVYPNFDIDLHGIPCKQRPDDRLDKVLSKTNYRVPNEWTCYLGIDPGHTHSAVSFIAVPPPDVGDYFIVYDEIYMQRGTAKDMATEIRKKMGDRKYHAFYFDMKAGRQTHIGVGTTIAQQYSEAFENEGIQSRLTNSGFMQGCDDPGARNMAVRKMMEPRISGTTKFRIFTETTPYHQHELVLYSKKVTRDDILEIVNKKDDHLMDAMAYVGASEPQFFMPPPEERKKSPAHLLIQQLRNKSKKSESTTIYLGAGAVPANY